MNKHTPRRSKRIRENDQPFQMPSREKVLDEIEDSPSKDIDSLRPKRLINNLIVENYRYNNKDDLPELSDDSEGLEEFIDNSDELESPKKKHCHEQEKETGSGKKKQRQKVRIYGSDDEDQLEEKRKSQRISRQPKKEHWKYDKEKALDKIFERVPDLKEVIDSDDADSFVCEDDVEEFESLDTELENTAEGNTDGINLDEVGDSDDKTSGGLGSESMDILERVDGEDVSNMCGGDVVHEVDSSDSACRDDTVSSVEGGRKLVHKNLSPVILGKIHYSSGHSSDPDVEVINISSDEGSGTCDIETDCRLDNGAKESSAGIADSSFGEAKGYINGGDSLVDMDSKRDDASDELGKPDEKQAVLEMQTKEAPGSQNSSWSSMQEDETMKGDVVQGNVSDSDSGIHDNGQVNKSILSERTSGHISSSDLDGTGNLEGSPEKYKIPTNDTDDRGECVVLGEEATGKPGKIPAAESIKQNDNNDVEEAPEGSAAGPDMDEDGSDSDSEIRTGKCLRSKLHHRKQLAKVLDSEDEESDEDSESEINNSFARRRKKETRKSITIDSDDDDD